tara:strand:+ start:2977 stop:3114 length:138 start_codon:yes stop_codon:yes gene_type:complete
MVVTEGCQGGIEGVWKTARWRDEHIAVGTVLKAATGVGMGRGREA